ncbi:MAG: RNB domain-containing ribonuclease, partial [Gaiellales bacterium]
RGAARPWPSEVDEEVASLPADPLPSDPARVDQRELLTFTIDPPDARDFDDAISVRRDPDGLRIWVHIADVSCFVAAGRAVDGEAARRGTSVYLPGRVEPMLPERLSAGLCSLQPGVERYAVTVEVAPGGGDTSIYRSRIVSDHRLSYQDVERILADPAAAGDLVTALREAAAFAEGSRQARARRGAVEVTSPELEFLFEGGRVVAAEMAAEHAAHGLVEEFMLLANERVAELLAAARAPALFRVHEPPDPEAIEALVARLAALEVPTPPMPELRRGAEAAAYAARLSVWIARYTRQSGRGREAFPALLLRSLKRAVYHPVNLGHSGLASPAYCHFTSPIRRYPDLVVHRALLGHLGLAEPAHHDLDALAVSTSEAEREAAKLEHDGDDICLAFLLERELFDRGWEAGFPGEVIGMIDSGLFVRFGRVFEGLLPARLLGRERYELDALGVAMVGASSGHAIRLGDPIEVYVRSIDRPRGRVLLMRRPQGE